MNDRRPLSAPIVEYVRRPKPFTPAEHKTRRLEELRAAIANMRRDRDILTMRIEVAEGELKRLERK